RGSSGIFSAGIGTERSGCPTTCADNWKKGGSSLSFMNRKGLWPGERGTLTVYAAVVLVPLLLFQLVLLDFVRIRLAEAEEEAALRSAVRSVLSAYDPSLRDYGLFGL